MSVKFHFLNVGSGDSTFIHFPIRTASDGREKKERIMMLDICHNEDHDSYEDIISYYKNNFSNEDGSLKPIFRFICSHPHHDHICGLSRFFEEKGIKIFNFWDLDHSFEPESFDGHPTHEDDWKIYRNLGEKGSSATVLRLKRETKPGDFWSDDEDRITILSPSNSLIQKAHYKDDGKKRDMVEIDEMSYAISIKINKRKIILAGDGRATPCWDDIYENCKEEITGCNILKAGHHGQEASFHEDAVKAMNPGLIIFSNSQEEDKKNGAERLYKKAVPEALILKTCVSGTITVEVPFDGKKPIIYNELG